MTKWKEYKLGEIAEIVMGQSPKGETCNNNGIGVPLLNGPTEFGSHCPLPTQYTTDPKKYSGPDDLLFCVRGSTTGKMNWSDQKYAIGRGIAAIRHKNGVKLKHFIKGIINYNLPHLLQSATGSTFPNVSKDQLNNLIVNAPDIDTQTAIAEILSSLDDKIELNNKINQELEALAQTLFKHWFIDFEFPDENGNPYKSSGGAMLDSELGEIPKGWEVGIFKDHIKILRGLSYKGSGLSDSETGIPMVNLNSIFEGGGYKYQGIKYYAGIFKEKNTIEPWDLAVANTEQGHKYMLIGYPAYVPKSLGKIGIFSHHIYKVKTLNSTHLTNQFFYYLIKAPQIREQIIGACNGTTVNMLKIDGLETPKFAKPEKNLISTFTSIACNVWEAIENNHLLNEQLKDLRDTLLPKLISGELEVSEVLTQTTTLWQ